MQFIRNTNADANALNSKSNDMLKVEICVSPFVKMLSLRLSIYDCENINSGKRSNNVITDVINDVSSVTPIYFRMYLLPVLYDFHMADRLIFLSSMRNSYPE